MKNMKLKLGYIGVILLVIALGISSRVFSDKLPLFISSHAGDALWGSMVYLGFRVLLNKHKLRLSLVLGLLFSYAIECSQLYQGEWINGVRSTVLGGLILGKGFLWIDLIRYFTGIGMAFALDYFILNSTKTDIDRSPRKQKE
ncbi:hypothetical protein PWYN_17685 [Paenibacillus wynnii]|uniref:DUF2809 domain-containing protein n=2 Tax=Paenibacillus wynnii TaxID=268407 RepID=A0A098M2I8_9BACL|nr:DUF2809 domain-containing protein [Paenibacillus wynnii]KGE16550.1 hypothetical protein PWYN_17685 [Paenibacillus wynnii]